MKPHPHFNNPEHSYLGNPCVKRAGVIQDFTEYEQREYLRCMQSPSYFARKYGKIISLDKGLVPFDLWPYQDKMYEHFEKYRFSVVLAPRQSGKSISVVMYLLWFACFRPDKPVAVLANKGATAREMLSRITLALENLPFFLQPGCRELNKGSIVFDNNSKIFAAATSGSSIRGKSIALLYLDEFAFVQNAEEFYTSTYPVVTSGTTTRVIITSTPKGVGNMFHKIWEGAMQGTSEYRPFRVHWWDVPGRDDKWKEMTIRNTSQLQFDQEFSCSFIGTGSTLIDGNALMGLKAINPTYTQNGMKVYEKPIKGEKPSDNHRYILTCDVGRGKTQDYSAFHIIDVSVKPFKQVASYRSNTMSPLLLPDVIYKYARAYNDAYVIVESNDQGVIVCNGLYYDLEYENMFLESTIKSDAIGVTTTKRTKRIGCSNLKDMIETHKLEVVDSDTIMELSTFEAKGTSYEASEGNHDDTVMALVVFAWFASTDLFAQMADINLKDMLYSERLTLIEDDVAPVGIFSQVEDVKDKYVVEGGDVWTSVQEHRLF